jgi:hypothetical protein
MDDEQAQGTALAIWQRTLPELTADTVARWIAEADKLSLAEIKDVARDAVRSTEGWRLRAGWMLWVLRRRYAADDEFGRAASQLAEAADVTTATLRNWRLGAERVLGLDPALEQPRDTRPRGRESRSRPPRTSRSKVVEARAVAAPTADGDTEACPRCGGTGRVPAHKPAPPIPGTTDSDCDHPKDKRVRGVTGLVKCKVCNALV